MKNYKLTIPKPCHEGWSTMTPNEKGRFCTSCSKTVVDFTKKSPEEIQSYFIENSGSRICGHFKRSQLDSIVIQIPDTFFQQNILFQKLFLLVLVLTMGTMLFSCKTDEGKIQKIDKVEVIDSISNKVLDSFALEDKILKKQKDSLYNTKQKKRCTLKKENLIEETGEIVPYIEKVELEEEPKIIEVEDIEDIVSEGEVMLGMPISHVEELPKFNGSTSANFQNDVRNFVIEELQKDNFLSSLDSGTYKFEIQFFISKIGTFTKIEVTTTYKIISKKITDILTNAPKLFPAKQNGVPKEIKYNLPLTLVIE